MEKIYETLFQFQIEIKLYHWNTPKYSHHKITDEFGTDMLNIIDSFTESFIGKYNINPCKTTNLQININHKFLNPKNNHFVVTNQIEEHFSVLPKECLAY